MSVRNLNYLFNPGSVAIIGASARTNSVGEIVLRNMIAARFRGELLPVNPKYDELAGLKVYPSVDRLPGVPELAVICTPAATVPGLIADLGARGTKAAIVISAGLGADPEGGAGPSGRRCLKRRSPISCAYSAQTAWACWSLASA